MGRWITRSEYHRDELSPCNTGQTLRTQGSCYKILIIFTVPLPEKDTDEIVSFLFFPLKPQFCNCWDPPEGLRTTQRWAAKRLRCPRRPLWPPASRSCLWLGPLWVSQLALQPAGPQAPRSHSGPGIPKAPSAACETVGPTPSVHIRKPDMVTYLFPAIRCDILAVSSGTKFHQLRNF